MSAPEERKEKVKESVDRAKEAVALDVSDGTSWSEWLHNTVEPLNNGIFVQSLSSFWR